MITINSLTTKSINSKGKYKMLNKNQFKKAHLFFAVILTFIAIPALAQTLISSLPYTITKRGNYYINQNLSFTQEGAAITVYDSVVNIDLGNFVITGAGKSAEFKQYGIVDGRRAEYINISNGTIEEFSGEGINMRAHNLTVSGITVKNSGSTGILLKGIYTVIDRSEVSNSLSGFNVNGGSVSLCRSYQNQLNGFDAIDAAITRSFAQQNGGYGFYIINSSATENYSLENSQYGFVQSGGLFSNNYSKSNIGGDYALRSVVDPGDNY